MHIHVYVRVSVLLCFCVCVYLYVHYGILSPYIIINSAQNPHETHEIQVALSTMHTLQDVHHGAAWPAIPGADRVAADGIGALQEEGVLALTVVDLQGLVEPEDTWLVVSTLLKNISQLG